jgi:hypothetical protein
VINAIHCGLGLESEKAGPAERLGLGSLREEDDHDRNRCPHRREHREVDEARNLRTAAIDDHYVDLVDADQKSSKQLYGDPDHLEREKKGFYHFVHGAIPYFDRLLLQHVYGLIALS